MRRPGLSRRTSRADGRRSEPGQRSASPRHAVHRSATGPSRPWARGYAFGEPAATGPETGVAYDRADMQYVGRSGYGRHLPGVPALVAGLALAMAACATNPVEGTLAPGPASASTTRDGVVVTVAASDDTVTGGDTIRLRVTVLNAGLGPVTWQSGGCGLLQWFGIDGPDLEQPPAGQVWPGGRQPDQVVGHGRWRRRHACLGPATRPRPRRRDGLSGGPRHTTTSARARRSRPKADWPATTSRRRAAVTGADPDHVRVPVRRARWRRPAAAGPGRTRT